jgi:hypothetical protein
MLRLHNRELPAAAPEGNERIAMHSEAQARPEDVAKMPKQGP